MVELQVCRTGGEVPATCAAAVPTSSGREKLGPPVRWNPTPILRTHRLGRHPGACASTFSTKASFLCKQTVDKDATPGYLSPSQRSPAQRPTHRTRHLTVFGSQHEAYRNLDDAASRQAEALGREGPGHVEPHGLFAVAFRGAGDTRLGLKGAGDTAWAGLQLCFPTGKGKLCCLDGFRRCLFRWWQ